MSKWIYKIEIEFDDEIYQNFINENLIDDEQDKIIENILSDVEFIKHAYVDFACEKEFYQKNLKK